jgi:hypothetical protein
MLRQLLKTGHILGNCHGALPKVPELILPFFHNLLWNVLLLEDLYERAPAPFLCGRLAGALPPVLSWSPQLECCELNLSLVSVV